MKDKLVQDLKNENLSQVVSKWILERSVPFVFRNDHLAFSRWKLLLASKLGIDPHSFVVVGSACVGFSLNPDKNWKPFDDDSDIDVAVVSHTHFEKAWFFLRHMGSSRYKYPQLIKETIELHESTYIYWGTIATDMILGVLPFGADWLTAIGEMSKTPPTDQRELNLRLYKDFEALRAYQLHTFKKLRQKIIGSENTPIKTI